MILINALSYGAVIWQLEHMDTSLLRSPKPVARTPGMLLEGVRYVRSQPKMMMILVMVFFAGTFGMNFQITSALMATEVFGKGAGEYGILGSAMAIGSLAGALLAARRVRIRVRLLVGAALGFGVAEIVAGLMPTYVAFALMCPVIGLCTLTMLNSANSTMQLESSPALRGRVMALYMTIVMGGTPIGSPIIGWVGQHFGPRWTLVGGGVLVIVGVLLALALFARPSRAAAEAAAAAEPERVAMLGGVTSGRLGARRISFWPAGATRVTLRDRVRLVRTVAHALLPPSGAGAARSHHGTEQQRSIIVPGKAPGLR